MKSVLDADKDTIDKGKLLQGAMDRGMNSFSPDMLMEKFVENYKLAKKLMGQTMVRKLTGYDPDYVEKNIQTPEFRKEMQKNIEQTVQSMKKEGLLNKEHEITDKALELVSLTTYVEELDKIVSQGFFGERFNKQINIHGMREDIKNFRKGDKYRDIAIRKSITNSIKRQHSSLMLEDLKVHERKSKGEIEIVYALDASSSMKGEKLGAAKRAGVALSFRAIDEKDRVGLLVFGDEIFSKVYPSKEFGELLKEITRVTPKGQTNFANVIMESIELFSSSNNTKHLLILSDALPTAGDKPERETLEAVSSAAAAGITISMVGLNLDKEGENLGRKMVELGNGKFYIVQDVSELDRVILLDYYSL
jgi:Mg-chelatase subunit ChlD